LDQGVAKAYKQPRRFNLVSFLLLLLVAGGVYYGWKWGPPYVQSWKVDTILQEGGAKLPMLSNQPVEQRIANERDLANQLKGQIRDLGITDPGLTVSVTDDGTNAHLVADWTVMITHPFNAHAPSPDHFHRDVVQEMHSGL
jgi:hypothetical protein